MEHSSTPDIVDSVAAQSGGGAHGVKLRSPKVPVAGGVIAGIAASICCIAPLLLVALGFSGAAVGLIAFFTPWRPIFIGLALLFLGVAAYRLFFVPKMCAPGMACADPRTLRHQRWLFIGAVIVTAALVAFPWYLVYLA